MSGLDEPVRRAVLTRPEAIGFLDRYEDLLAALTGNFVAEGKRFLTIALGCTGGRHRSVAMAEALADRLDSYAVERMVVHRDLGRE
jgi:RNase adapter protein RapZ